MKVENEMALPTTKSVAVMLLEPYAGKLARTVLRGESSRKGADLLDSGTPGYNGKRENSCFYRRPKRQSVDQFTAQRSFYYT